MAHRAKRTYKIKEKRKIIKEAYAPGAEITVAAAYIMFKQIKLRIGKRTLLSIQLNTSLPRVIV